ncbi:hypothetical protein [Companilactobacillus baiquanensis]|uniref:Lipoprotein n=1 Tax=Companilactobacillus baiquanensis TaxID=2486005 RepID=A0ABW1UUP2_9LACO|nr:hypothetical protein [Companilactobacillus baiquanensis]
MRKRNYLLLIISMIFLLILGGCTSAKPKLSKTSSNGNIVIKGHNFRGLYQGNGTANDPDYKYSMYFGKDGNFVQDIISSKGFAGRFTEKGTYTIAKNGDVTMNIDSVTEERFSSDAALRKGKAPTSIVQRQGNTLSAAEDHPIKIENKKSYLLGTVNKVKLYPTSKATVNYHKHYRSELKKYDSAHNSFSGHGFTSNGMDTPMNAITFKNNKFIWRYGYQDSRNTAKNSAVMAVFQGTYSYNSNNHIMTLKVSNQSKAYYGDLMKLGGFEYQKIGESLAGKTLKLKYHDNDLDLISGEFDTWTMEDGHPDDASQSQPKYDDYINSYSVSTFDSQMKKGSSSDSSGRSVEDVFPTKEDFADWVTDYFRNKGDDYFHVLEAGDGETLPVRSPEKMDGTSNPVPMIYRLYYSIAEEGNEISDVGRNIGITEDGKLYSGHFIMYDDELTQAYRAYANN